VPKYIEFFQLTPEHLQKQLIRFNLLFNFINPLRPQMVYETNLSYATSDGRTKINRERTKIIEENYFKDQVQFADTINYLFFILTT
jgi:hypothetical protein